MTSTEHKSAIIAQLSQNNISILVENLATALARVDELESKLSCRRKVTKDKNRTEEPQPKSQ